MGCVATLEPAKDSKKNLWYVSLPPRLSSTGKRKREYFQSKERADVFLVSPANFQTRTWHRLQVHFCLLSLLLQNPLHQLIRLLSHLLGEIMIAIGMGHLNASLGAEHHINRSCRGDTTVNAFPAKVAVV